MSIHVMRFTGTGFELVSDKARAKERLDKEFVVGKVYSLEQAIDTTATARRYYHHCLTEAWHNLPETVLDEFPAKEHLRKYCLIKAGHCTVRKDIYVNEIAAQIAAATTQDEDDYAIATAQGRVVTTYRAKSEKLLRGKAWREMKEKVLHEASVLIGVDVTTLVKSEPA